jgi:hypothetical protein
MRDSHAVWRLRFVHFYTKTTRMQSACLAAQPYIPLAGP